VLAGAKPADLPVENVTHLVFVLNRRTARELGRRGAAGDAGGFHG